MEEIEVIGAIVYTGPDAAARQTSTFFGGSQLFHKLLDDNAVDVRKVIDRITTYFKCVNRCAIISHLLTSPRSAELHKKGVQLASIIGVNVERRPGEARRDRDRRVFTAMMQDSLSKLSLPSVS
jgi:hypothetical protein